MDVHIPNEMEWKVSVGLARPVNVDHLQRWSWIFQFEGTETDLSIWLLPKISRIFVIMESTHYLNVKSELINMAWTWDKENSESPKESNP